MRVVWAYTQGRKVGYLYRLLYLFATGQAFRSDQAMCKELPQTEDKV